MALTLIVETGDIITGANTYISLADAETYFEGRVNVTTWDAATDATKNAALVQAARILDTYVTWVGWLTDTDQPMKWPRAGIYYDGYGGYYGSYDLLLSTSVFSIADNEIPAEVKDAQCELALVLLKKDTQSLPATLGFKSIAVAGTVDLEIDKRDRVSEIPAHIWHIISQFGSKKGGASVRLMRG